MIWSRKVSGVMLKLDNVFVDSIHFVQGSFTFTFGRFFVVDLLEVGHIA